MLKNVKKTKRLKKKRDRARITVGRKKTIGSEKSEFVSLTAHQLRTPLSVIKGALRMLLDGDFGEITEEQRDCIEKIYKRTQRMIALVDNLLDVTRIKEGGYCYKPAPVQIENVVRLVANSFKEESKRKKIKLEFKTPKTKLPKVKVDLGKIKIAINNLLDNAIRYTPTGGEVTVSLKRGKKEIEFSVKDTGVGIPKKQKRYIFTKFFRGVNVAGTESGGIGLGLFITKNIIEAHGGKIWFESKENVGTTFHFTLPFGREKK